MPRPFAPLALPPPPLLLPAALPLLLPPAGSSASSVTDARAPAEKRRERGKVGQDRKEDKNGKKRREAENGKKVRGGKKPRTATSTSTSPEGGTVTEVVVFASLPLWFNTPWLLRYFLSEILLDW